MLKALARAQKLPFRLKAAGEAGILRLLPPPALALLPPFCMTRKGVLLYACGAAKKGTCKKAIEAELSTLILHLDEKGAFVFN